MGVTYGQGEPLGTVVHSFHIHVWSEQRDYASLISVCFEAFEYCLGIVQDGATRVQREWAI